MRELAPLLSFTNGRFTVRKMPPDSEIDNSISQNEFIQDDLTFRNVLLPIWRGRKTILIVSLVVGLLTYGVNLLFSDYFRATTSLLPSADKGKFSALGDLAEVAALAGVKIPGSEVSRLYPAILTSESVIRPVLMKRFAWNKSSTPITLIEYYGLHEDEPEKNLEKALKLFLSDLQTSYDARTGIVSASLVMDDPHLTADILNSVIGELDSFMRSKQFSNATEQVRWLESRLVQVSDSLHLAERALKAFREKNRRVSDSPDLLMQQDRLGRDVQVNSAVYIELKKQYEIAKLEQIRNMSIINVLDSARPVLTKVGPRRKTNSAIGFFLAFLATSAFYVVKDIFGSRIREVRLWLNNPSKNDGPASSPSTSKA